MVQDVYVINMMGKYGRSFATKYLISKKNTPSSLRMADTFFFFFRLGTNIKHFEAAGFYKQS